MRKDETALATTKTVAVFGAIDTSFRWRTAGGAQFLRPARMQTRHLFHTFRMIWSHAVQEGNQLTVQGDHANP